MRTGLHPRPVPLRRSHVFVWARLCILFITLPGCYLLPTDLTTPVSDVAILSDQTTVSVGGTTQLTAVVRDSAGNILPARIVTWTSSNTSVATVAWSGPMTAIAAGMAQGSAVITANSEGITDTLTVTVTVLSSATAGATTSSSITTGTADAHRRRSGTSTSSY